MTTQVKIQTTFSPGKALFKKYSKIAILVDQNTRKHCLESARSKFPEHLLIEVPAGEEHKNLETCKAIWDKLTHYRLDRHSLLIIMGGGVLGDMGGFCAGTFKRGIDFCLVPTTLLAQVDASIGGKLAIDFGPYKNHIGLFQLPVATLIAVDFLKTLPFRELRSGFAEVVKHCLISDARMWRAIQSKKTEDQSWLKLVRHSVTFKSAVVRKDPREKGLRKILNFGHTVGHSLEGYLLSEGTKILHGEAIAAGMIMEGYIAGRKKLLRKEETEAIKNYLFGVFGKTELPAANDLMPLIRQDKKNKGNEILMALPKGIGKAVWDIPVSEGLIIEAMDYYSSCQT